MSTGPRTPRGKKVSSTNAVTHGCCSTKLLLQKEDEQEWQKLQQSWLDDYQPETKTFAELLLQTAEAEWLLRRNASQYNLLQNSLNENPLQWTEEDHRQIERFSRYRTTAERRFMRFRNAVELTRKNRALEAHRRKLLDLSVKQQNLADHKASKSSDAIQDLNSGPNSLTAEPWVPLDQIKPIPMLRQSVEVRVKDGKTKTTVHPSNEELIERSKIKNPPAELIYRTMHFCDGFPPEYEWVRNLGTWTSNAREQVLTPAQWLAAIDREQRNGTGHIGPVEQDTSETDETRTAEEPGTDDLSGPECEKEPEEDIDS
jgi:hypothetical protein